MPSQLAYLAGVFDGEGSFGMWSKGKKKGRDWLLYYDGSYNPDIEPISYYSPDLMMYYKSYMTLRLRCNYWVTNRISFYFDIRNLTNHSDMSRSIIEPALGKQIKVGLDLEI